MKKLSGGRQAVFGATLLAGMLAATMLVALPALAADGPVGQPHAWQFGLQEGVTAIKDSIHSFHTLMMIIITAITLFVSALLVYVMIRFSAKRNPVPSKTGHNTLVEIAWTVIPVIILIVVSVPSIRLLYFQERMPAEAMTIKAIGNQWYWSYEYPDNGGFTFDATMIADKDLKPGQLRLLETENTVVLPVNTNVRVQITAADVLHSWAMPAFGVKKDAVPGRLNEIWFNARKEGVYYGQCSELCGSLHGYMPIKVEIVSKEKFEQWVGEAKQKFAAVGAAPVALAASDAR